MKKIVLSVVAVSTLATTGVFAASDMAEMFKEGKASGQVRTFYINRAYDFKNGSTSDYSRDGLALGGKLGFETAALHGISAGTVLYTTNKLDNESKTASKNDKTLFDGNDDGYTMLGQAYLQGVFGKTTVKIGRQQLDTPLAGSDDARMLPNLFEAAVVTNGDLPNTTLIGAHVTRIAYGTFANAYAGGELALTSGYGDRKDYKNGTFQTMSKAALGDGVDNNGVTAAAVIYKGIPNLTLQAWDYYAHNILNAFYAQADFGWNCLINSDIKMTGSAQYIKESGVGDKLAGDVNSQYYGVQLAAKYANLNAAAAYSATSKDGSATLKGGIITPWGGVPAFTQGMVTRHQFMSDTTAYKLSAGYNLKDMLGQNITALAYYTSFKVGTSNSYTAKVTTSESGFDIIYNDAGIKNLQLRLRGNFPRDFKKTVAGETTSWNEYRVIANYNF
jgi:hypothetical protein